MGNTIENETSGIQPGSIIDILWAQFNAQFPTKEDCWKELYRVANGINPFKCRFCGKQGLEIFNDSRSAFCNVCHKKTWLTAGSFFNRIRVPKAWLGAIWFMEQGIVLSSSRFHSLAGIAQSSALNILRKLRVVIQNNLSDVSSQMPSGVFSRSFIKRSRMTPADSHPQAEEQNSENFNEVKSNDLTLKMV